MKAFISYSHKDENYLERLKIHLAQIKRDGLLTEWTDKEIHAGENLDNNIDNALSNSEIFLALISPDYIASNYCYEKEFETAQKMQDDGKLIIVPIILEPCDWQKTPFGNLKAIPKDGKSISEFTNQNIAFLNIIDELRRLIDFSKQKSISANLSTDITEKLVRNYKIKKQFSDVDKYNFLEKSFADLKIYFRSAISELDSLEDLQARFTNEDKSSFTCLLSNRANNQNSFLTIYLGSKGQNYAGDLNYTFSDIISTNTIQSDKIFDIDHDDYDQFWAINSKLNSMYGRSVERYTAHQVAEKILNDYIGQVGVSVD